VDGERGELGERRESKTTQENEITRMKGKGNRRIIIGRKRINSTLNEQRIRARRSERE
jgi:hypothetical protein